jgi:hypothetical protein
MTVRKLHPTTSAERSRRYRERRKAEIEAANVTPEIATVTPAVTPTRVRAGNVTVGMVLSSTGVLLAGLGACMSVSYLAAGADETARLLLGGLAASADAVALLSPSRRIDAVARPASAPRRRRMAAVARGRRRDDLEHRRLYLGPRRHAHSRPRDGAH